MLQRNEIGKKELFLHKVPFAKTLCCCDFVTVDKCSFPFDLCFFLMKIQNDF